MDELVDRRSMSMPPPEADPQLSFLEAFVAGYATVAGDVLEITPRTWAIHGSIAVDGDVIMAEFDTEERARIVLHALSTGRSAREPG
jgi:hypothetical protein